MRTNKILFGLAILGSLVHSGCVTYGYDHYRVAPVHSRPVVVVDSVIPAPVVRVHHVRRPVIKVRRPAPPPPPIYKRHPAPSRHRGRPQPPKHHHRRPGR